MSKQIKVHDVYAPEVVAIAELAYVELKYAKRGLRNAQANGEKEGSILLTLNNENTPHIDADIELTVEDAEALALHILSLCGAVKHN